VLIFFTFYLEMNTRKLIEKWMHELDGMRDLEVGEEGWRNLGRWLEAKREEMDDTDGEKVEGSGKRTVRIRREEQMEIEVDCGEDGRRWLENEISKVDTVGGQEKEKKGVPLQVGREGKRMAIRAMWLKGEKREVIMLGDSHLRRYGEEIGTGAWGGTMVGVGGTNLEDWVGALEDLARDGRTWKGIRVVVAVLGSNKGDYTEGMWARFEEAMRALVGLGRYQVAVLGNFRDTGRDAGSLRTVARRNGWRVKLWQLGEQRLDRDGVHLVQGEYRRVLGGLLEGLMRGW
jgi:hypothetical protein